MSGGDQRPVLFTQSGCTDSLRVRAWLIGHGIAFTERDITGDIDAARALAATGTFATPLVVTGGGSVLGFRPDALAFLLAPKD